MPEAGDQVVVHHAHGLHVGIANGGAEKAKALLFHVLADDVGQRCSGWAFAQACPMVLNWLAVGKTPKVITKAAVAIL